MGPRGPRAMGRTSDKKLDIKTFVRLLGYFKNYIPHIIGVIACIVAQALVTVRSANFIGTIIDTYLNPVIDAFKNTGTLDTSAFDKDGLLGFVLGMAVLYLISITAAFVYQRIMIVVSQGILKDVRDSMFAKMQTLPIKFFDTNSHGDIMSLYTNDTDTLRQMISQTMPQMLSSCITIVTVFISMLQNNILMAAITVAMVSVILFITRKITFKSAGYFIDQQRALGDVNGYIEEMIGGQKVVKVFNYEDKARAEFDKRNDFLCESATKGNKLLNNLGPINNNLAHLEYALLAVAGGAIVLFVENNALKLTVGGLVTFLALFKNFQQPINNIMQQFNTLIMAMAGASRIFELLDQKPEVDDGNVTLVNCTLDADGNITECEHRTGKWAWKCPQQDGSFKYVEMCGDVRFDEVDFGYEPDKTVLHDITLYAKPGQKVAFVGATGAGKTTITNLINRFYDIADGKIKYDGININHIKKADLRRSLGIVLQDVNLFTGTVMDNIRYGRLDATDEECRAAAKLAGADGFINMLPKGYDTVLEGDGSGLSQGQRQLIAIARAAVMDPPVMILDEATSSIDTRTESIVQKGMDSLMEGRTVFVIAHRLSTVRNSNVIMVLDHGVIIERGTHEQLIEQKGQYYRLYTGAFELE